MLLINKCGIVVLVLGRRRKKELLLTVEKNKAQSSSELLLSYIAEQRLSNSCDVKFSFCIIALEIILSTHF